MPPKRATRATNPLEIAQASAPVTRNEFAGLEKKMDVLLNTFTAFMDQQQAGGGEEEEVMEEEEEEEAPGRIFRGALGECPPTEERFSFLDKKVRDMALAGRLPGEKLPLLIPPSTDIYSAAPGDSFVTVLDEESRQFFAAPAKATPSQIAEKFVKAIPNVAVFVYAWSNLIDLMMDGCGYPEASHHVYVALNSHARWMIENSTIFTWESLVKYHLKIVEKRCSANFHTSAWYDAYDGLASTCLIRKDAAPANRGNNSNNNIASGSGTGSSNNRKKRAPAATKAGSGEVCFRYQVEACPLKNCPRVHVCSNDGCSGKHPAIKCPKAKA